MPDEIFISIIIPFYNSQNHIENCLDSLQKQSFKKTYEIIMVDDGSTDGSVEIIKKCKNPFVKIFKLKENKGPAAARNLESGISYLQTGESVLFKVANLLTRLRELGVANDNAALLSTTQEGQIDAEVTAITATIDAVLDNTLYNGVEVIDSNASKSVAIAYNGSDVTQTHTAGAGVSITTIVNIQVGDTARATADTALSLVATALGNIAADLTALKSMQNAASATGANLVATGSRVLDTDFALETAKLTKNSILNQAAMAMSAQANQAQSAILSVLQ